MMIPLTGERERDQRELETRTQRSRRAGEQEGGGQGFASPLLSSVFLSVVSRVESEAATERELPPDLPNGSPDDSAGGIEHYSRPGASAGVLTHAGMNSARSLHGRTEWNPEGQDVQPIFGHREGYIRWT